MGTTESKEKHHEFVVGLVLLKIFKTYPPRVWQYGLWRFQTGGTKLERFLPNALSFYNLKSNSKSILILI